MLVEEEKKETRREAILNHFEENPNAELSCTEVSKIVIKRLNVPHNKQHYLSGSISSLLRKLVIRENKLKYSENKTDRGGHLYKLNI